MPSTSRRKFLCLDCNIDTGRLGEHYTLKDDVWYTIHSSQSGMLCIGCAEKRLGRTLVSSDFNTSHINRAGSMSQRLRSRIV